MDIESCPKWRQGLQGWQKAGGFTASEAFKLHSPRSLAHVHMYVFLFFVLFTMHCCGNDRFGILLMLGNC